MDGKKNLGFIIGLRYSSTIKKIKNNRLSYWTVLDFQYDRFEETFDFDSFPYSDSIVRTGNTARKWGSSDNRTLINQASLTFQFGLKYNFRRIRPALGYYVGYNIFSRTEGVGEIAQQFGIFKENGRLINKLHHGIKLDVYIHLTPKTGIVAGIAGSFDVRVPRTTYTFNNIGSYLHMGIDYKISK